MPDQVVDNPAGAFGPLIPDGLPMSGTAPGPRYVDCLNTGAATINPGEWVALDVTGTAGHIFGVIRGVHGGVIANGIGVAADTIKVGATGRVITEGPATAKAGAAGVAIGNLVGGSTVATDDGELVLVPTPTIGQVLGIALTTGAANGFFQMWVDKV